MRSRGTERSSSSPFSMWNYKKDGKVVLEKRGPGADVAEFHGEGEGRRCLMPLDWNKGEKVTLVVRAQKKAGDWLCSAHFIYRQKIPTIYYY